ncbi:MAG TPA: glucokinase [Dongiaceae bacterium]|nr:glucokinase [Dongiaceae bacterium]
MNATALVADIGGTNARFAMVDLDDLVVPRFETYPCANFRSLPEAAAAFVKDTGARPSVAAFDIAGPVSGDRGVITNLSWNMTTDELAEATGAKSVLLLNDFEALALSVQLMTANDLRQLGGGAPVERATKGVVGPGTGLGVGGLVWSASRWMPIPGEGGHTTFAAASIEEMEILSTAAKQYDHFSNERVVSGPGLVNLYVCFSARRGITLKDRVGANEITRRALANEDPVAVEALDFFVKALGRVAGDTALMMGARGGVYLGGGIPPKVLDFLTKPAFRQAFESKGRLTPFLQPIPVYVMLARDAGLRGAGVALKTALAEGRL